MVDLFKNKLMDLVPIFILLGLLVYFPALWQFSNFNLLFFIYCSLTSVLFSICFGYLSLNNQYVMNKLKLQLLFFYFFISSILCVITICQTKVHYIALRYPLVFLDLIMRDLFYLYIFILTQCLLLPLIIISKCSMKTQKLSFFKLSLLSPNMLEYAERASILIFINFLFAYYAIFLFPINIIYYMIYLLLYLRTYFNHKIQYNAFFKKDYKNYFLVVTFKMSQFFSGERYIVYDSNHLELSFNKDIKNYNKKDRTFIFINLLSYIKYYKYFETIKHVNIMFLVVKNKVKPFSQNRLTQLNDIVKQHSIFRILFERRKNFFNQSNKDYMCEKCADKVIPNYYFSIHMNQIIRLNKTLINKFNDFTDQINRFNYINSLVYNSLIYLNELPKNDIFWIKVKIESLKYCFDNTVLFYRLYKLIEYVTHLLFIITISNCFNEAKQKKIMIDELHSASLGKWLNFTYKINNKIDKGFCNYYDRLLPNNVIVKIKTIYEMIKINKKCKKWTYYSLYNFIVTLRNKTIGHGNISQTSISNYMAYNLTYIMNFMLVNIYYPLIKGRNILTECKLFLIKKEQNLYLFNGSFGETRDYLSYNDGEVLRVREDVDE